MREAASTELEDVLGQGFDWSQLEDVRVARVAPPANGPILMIVGGLVILGAAAGEVGWVGVPIGLAGIGSAIAWWIWKKPSFQLELEMRNGESTPFESQDREEVERLAAAIRVRLGGALGQKGSRGTT